MKSGESGSAAFEQQAPSPGFNSSKLERKSRKNSAIQVGGHIVGLAIEQRLAREVLRVEYKLPLLLEWYYLFVSPPRPEVSLPKEPWLSSYMRLSQWCITNA